MKIIYSFFNGVIARYRLVLFFQLLLVMFLANQALHTRFDASADSLILEGDVDLEFSREINKRYGSEDFLLVTYRPQEDLFSDGALGRLAMLRDELAAVAGVSSVTSILDVPLLYSPRLALTQISKGLPTLSDPSTDRQLVARELQQSPLYRGLLTNADNTVTVLQVNLARDERYFELLAQRDALRAEAPSAERKRSLGQAEAVFDEYRFEFAQAQRIQVDTVRAILDRHRGGAEIFLGGVSMIAVDLVTFVQQDLLVFGSGILLFIVLLLFVIFRRLRWVLIPLSICSITAVEMLGWLALVDWRLTVISANFVAILLIVNLSIVVHLIVRYRELVEADPDASQFSLIQQTVHSLLRPCTYTTLTTLVAFSSLVISGIRPVIDFGWMMVIGVSLALVNSFVLFSAMNMLAPREPAGASQVRVAFTHRFATIAERHGTLVLGVCLALVALTAVGISRLEVENRFIDYFDESTEIYRGMETIDRQLGGTMPLDLIIDKLPTEIDAQSYTDEFGDDPFAEEEDPFANGDTSANSPWYNRQSLEQVSQIHAYLESLPETGKVLSLATIFEISRDLVGDNIDNVELAITRANFPAVVSEVLVKPYIKDELGQTRLSMRVMETSEGLKRDELLKRIKRDLIEQFDLQPEQVRLTGLLVLYNNMLQSLYSSQILTLGAVFFAILAMFLMLFRSLTLALIAIAPNVLAAGLVLGGMGLVGIPLDMMTITIAAICIGIGVDDTIHYVHRFRREFVRDKDYLATMYRCHDSIGKAMYYTSVIVIFGFGILALSNFRPSIYFGLLTGFAMLAALLGALLLLPRLILLIKPLGPGVR